MNTGNDILFFMFIIIALFFIGTIVYLKRNITKLKKYLLFLSDKNKAFLFVILLFNVIWIPAVYVAHKYLGAFDTWQNSLLIIIVFIFVFILFNTGMIISFFEAWYQNNTQINNLSQDEIDYFIKHNKDILGKYSYRS